MTCAAGVRPATWSPPQTLFPSWLWWWCRLSHSMAFILAGRALCAKLSCRFSKRSLFAMRWCCQVFVNWAQSVRVWIHRRNDGFPFGMKIKNQYCRTFYWDFHMSYVYILPKGKIKIIAQRCWRFGADSIKSVREREHCRLWLHKWNKIRPFSHDKIAPLGLMDLHPWIFGSWLSTLIPNLVR